MIIDDIKTLLGIADTDTEQDEVLNVIIKTVSSRLASLIKEMTVPDSLDYIVTEVAVTRYNRLGSEGFSGHTVEGESISISDDDFKPFLSDINDYLDSKKPRERRTVRFI